MKIPFKHIIRYLVCLIAITIAFNIELNATHIVGGDLTYRHVEGDVFEVTLIFRRDCFNGADDAPLDNPANIAIYTGEGTLATWLGDFGVIKIPLNFADTLHTFITSDCGFIGRQVCVEETKYVSTVRLPFRPSGYHLTYQRCCRNITLNNITQPLNTGATYTVFISADAMSLDNSSPSFPLLEDVYICVNEDLAIDYSVIDTDGDVLVYKLCKPFAGATEAFPKPIIAPAPPYDEVEYLDPYSFDNPLGGIPLSIDSETGLLTGRPNLIGQFLVGICIEEYRDGKLLSTVRSDFEYNVRVCDDPPMAAFIIDNPVCNFNPNIVNESTGTDIFEWSYVIDGDTVVFSNVKDPDYRFENPGDYEIILLATRSADGCNSIGSQFITVLNSDLTASFDLELARCVDNAFEYTVTSTSFDVNAENEITEYNWSIISDDITTSLTGPEITFTSLSGEGMIELMVVSANTCTASITESFNAMDVIPNAEFDYTIISCNADGTFTLALNDRTDFQGNIQEYSWEIDINGNTQIFTGPTVELIVNASDIVSIMYSTILANECSTSVTEIIDISEVIPSASIDASITSCNTNGTADVLLIAVLNESYSVQSIEWTIGINGAAQSFNTESVELSDLEFDVQVDATLIITFTNGCEVTANKIFTPRELLPKADFTFAITSCNADGSYDVTLTNTSDDIESVVSSEWVVSIGGTETMYSGSIVLLSGLSGTAEITASLTVTYSSNCTASVEKSILVSDLLPTADFTVSLVSCGEDGVISIDLVNASSNLGDITSENWSIQRGEAIITSTTSPVRIEGLTEDEILTVTLDVVYSTGCSATVTREVMVSAILPMAGVTASVTSCNADGSYTVLIEDTSSNPTGISTQSIIVTVNGTSTTYTTLPIEIIVQENDVIEVQQSVSYGNGCMAEGTTSIDVSSIIPTAAITSSVSSCNADGTVDVTLSNGSNVTEGIAEVLWSVTVGGVTTEYTTNEVILSGLNTTEEIGATLTVNYDNGCSSTVTETILVSELLPKADFTFAITSCNADGSYDVTLTNTSDDIESVVSSEWVVSIGGTETMYSGSIVLLSGLSGTAEITASLTVTYSSNCTASVEKSILVSDLLPTADFTVSLVSCGEDGVISIDLVNASSNLGDITSENWSIQRGEAIITSTTSPVRIEGLTEDEILTVTLDVVYSTGCSATVTREVMVSAILPMAGVTASVTSCNADGSYTVLIEDTSSNASGISTQSIIVTVNGTSTTYTTLPIEIIVQENDVIEVQQSVSYGNGCMAEGTTSIDVSSIIPTAAITSSVSSCNADGTVDVTLSNGSNVTEGIAEVLWSVTVGGVTTEYTTNEVILSGLNTTEEIGATLTVNYDNGCSSTVTETILVSELLPKADFTFAITSCNADGSYDVTLTNTSDDIESVVSSEWVVSIGGTETMYSGSSVLLSGLSGTAEITASLTVTYSSNCTASVEKSILVSDLLPTADFTVSLVSCGEDGVISIDLVNASSNLGDITSENWSIQRGEAIITSTTSPVRIEGLTEDEILTVTLDVVYSTGCSATVTREVMVSAILPMAGVTASVTSCNADGSYTVLIEDTSSNPTGISTQSIIVTVNGTSTTYTTLPIEIIVQENDVIEVQQSVSYGNGCMAEGTTSIDVSSIIPTAAITSSVSSCNADGTVDVTLSNGSNVTEGIAEVLWSVTVGGVTTEYTTNEVILSGLNTTEEIGATLTVNYDNGCSSTVTETILVSELLPKADFTFAITSCNADGSYDVTLTNTSDDIESVVSSEWVVSIGGTETMYSGSIVLLSGLSGTAEITASLTVTYSSNCTASVEKSILVSDLLPTADFTVSLVSCGEDGVISIDLVNASSNLGDITSENWSIQRGEAIITSTTSPVRIEGLTEDEILTVTLDVVYSTGCSATVTREVMVSEILPMAGVTASVTSCNADGSYTVLIEDTSSNPTGISTQSIIVTVNGTSTTYTTLPIEIIVQENDVIEVQQSVSYGNGCMAEGTTSIDVSSIIPTAAITSSVSSCNADGTVDVTLSNGSNVTEGIAEVLWSVTVGGVTTEYTTNEVILSGLNTTEEIGATLTVNYDNGCSSTVTETILVSELLPKADFTFAITSCNADGSYDVTLTNTSDDIESVVSSEWVVNIGGTETMYSGSIVLLSGLSGTAEITASLTVTYSSNCTASVEKSILVSDLLPTADFTVSLVSCGEDGVISIDLVNASSNLGDITSENWSIQRGEAIITSTTSPVRIEGLTEDEILTVTLDVVYSTGCSSTVTREVMVSEILPMAGVTASVTSCNADGSYTVLIEDTSSNPTGISTQSIIVTVNGTSTTYITLPIEIIVQENDVIEVQQSVSYGNGCMAEGTTSIDVSSIIPTAAITSSVSSCNADGTVDVTLSNGSNVTEGIAEVLWSVTVGGVTTEYTTNEVILSGLNTTEEIGATLTVNYDNGCSSTVTETILVSELLPKADFTFAITSCNADGSYDVTLTNTSDDIESVVSSEWVVSIGGTETMYSGSIVLLSGLSGTAEITASLTVTYSSNCTASVEKSILVSDLLPTADFTVSLVSCGEDGVISIDLVNASSNLGDITSENWSIQRGEAIITSTTSPVRIEGLTEDEILTVTLDVVYSTGCSSTVTREVIVSAILPMAGVTASVTSCNADGSYTVLIEDTSSNPSGISTQSIIVTVNGTSTTYITLPIEIIVQENDVIEVQQSVSYGNGCMAEGTTSIDVSSIIPTAAITSSVSSCNADGTVDVTLSNGSNVTEGIAEVLWSVTVGGVTTEYTTNEVILSGLNTTEEIGATLTVNYDNGCSSTVTETILVSELLPKADFTFAITSCNADGSYDVTLTNTSDDIESVVSSEWVVSIGGTETMYSGSSVLLSGLSGTAEITASLTVTYSSNCTASVEKSILVSDLLPTADFTVSLVSCGEDGVISIDLVNASSNLGDITSENWSIQRGEAIITSTTSPVRIEGLTEDEILTVTLDVVYSTGCSSTVTREVIVSEILPMAGVTASVTSCNADGSYTVLIEDTSSNPTGISTQSIIVTVNGTSTTYITLPIEIIVQENDVIEVQQSVSYGNGCMAEGTTSIDVSSIIPTAAITSSVSSCNADGTVDVTLSNGSNVTEGIAEVLWSVTVGGVTTEYTTNEVILSGLNTTEEIGATLTVNYDNGCSSTVTETILVSELLPKADFTFAITSCNADGSYDVTLTNTSDDIESVVSSEWVVSIGGTETMYSGSSVLLSGLSGTAEITASLTVTYSSNCTASVEKSILVSDLLPTADFTVSLVSCGEDGVISIDLVNASSNLGDITSENWSIQRGEAIITSTTSPVRIEGLTEDEILTVTLDVVYSTGCSATITREVMVSEILPMAGVTATVTSCNADGSYTISIENDSSNPDIIITQVINISINGSSTSYTELPVEIIIVEGDVIEIMQSVNYGNGCMAEASTTLNLSEILPQALFDIRISSCNADGSVNVVIENMSTNNDKITSSKWIIIINGVAQEFNSSDVELENVTLSGVLGISLEVNFENGCSDELIKEISIRELLPKVDFSFRISSCNADGSYDVTLTNTSDDIESVVSSEWVVSIGGTETMYSGSIVLLSGLSGTAEITASLTVTYSSNCTASVEKSILVSDLLPTADFTVSLVSCGEDGVISIDLVNASSNLGDITSENWSIQRGEAIITSTTSPVRIEGLTEDEILTVTLDVVYSTGCSATVTREVMVSAILPMAGVTASVTSCNADGSYTVLIEDTSSNPTGISTQSIIVTVNGTSTTYTTLPIEIIVQENDVIEVHQSVSYGNGCMAEGTTSIDVSSIIPTAAITSSVSSCNADGTVDVTLSNGSNVTEGIAEVLWSVTVGGVTTEYTTNEVILSGLNTTEEIGATLTVNYDNGCSSTVTETILVSELLPKADFTFAITSCNSDGSYDVTLTNTSDDIESVVSSEWVVSIGGTETMYSGSSVLLSGLSGTAEITASLTVTYSSNCTASVEKSILVSDLLPTADFTVSLVSCGEDGVISIDLVNASSNLGDITSENWSIQRGEAIITSTTSPVRIEGLTEDEILTVTLDVVYSTECSATVTREVMVSAILPMAGVTASVTSCNADGSYTVLIEDTSSNPTGISTQSIIVTVNGTSTTYTTLPIEIIVQENDVIEVQQSVSYGNGCMAEGTTSIDVSSIIPTAAITSSVSSCNADGTVDVTLSNGSNVTEGIAEVLWSVTVGGVTTEYTTNEVILSGLNTTEEIGATLTVNYDNGCSSTVTETILVSELLPKADFTFAITSCNADGSYDVTLTNTSDDIESVVSSEWVVSIGGTETMYSGSSVLLSGLSGTAEITASLTVTYSSNCTASVEKSILVSDLLPTADFTVSLVSCGEDGVISIDLVNASSNLGDITSENWSIQRGEAIITSTTSPVRIEGLTEDEILTVTLDVVYSTGCSSTVTREVMVSEILPMAGVTASVTSCNADGSYTVLIEDTSSNPTGISTQSIIVTVNGTSTTYTTLPIEIIVQENDVIEVQQSVSYGNGCMAEGTTSIDVSSIIPTAAITSSVSSCNADGTVDVTLSNGSNVTEGIAEVLWSVTVGGVTTEYTTNEVILSGISTTEEIGATLTVNYDNGCSSTVTETILVSELLPMIGYTSELLSCDSENIINIRLVSQSSYDISSITWVIINGERVFNSEEETIDINIDRTIPSIVEINAIFINGCSDTLLDTLNINDVLPQPSFVSNVDECTSESEVTLTLTENTSIVDSIVGWSWMVNSGGQEFSGNEKSLTITVNRDSLVIASLDVTLENGCVLILKDSTFLPSGFPNIQLDEDRLQGCIGDTVNLLSTLNPNWTYSWNPEELVFLNPETGLPQTIIPSSEERYTLKVNDGVCTDSVDLIVGVDTSTIVRIMGDTVDCEGAVLLTAEIADGVGTIQWSSRNDFLIILAEGDTLRTTQFSTNTYYARVINGTCANTIDSIDVFLGAINIFPIPFEICQGDTSRINLVNLEQIQELSFVFEPDSHIVADDSTGMPTIGIGQMETDSFYLFYYVENQFGCSTNDSLLVKIVDNPMIDFTSSLEVCGEYTVCFEITMDYNGRPRWDFGDPSSGFDNFSVNPNPCHTYPGPGEYIVTLETISNFCPADPVQKTIRLTEDFNVSPVSDTTICVGDSIAIPASASVDGLEFVWCNSNGDTLFVGDTFSYIGQAGGLDVILKGFDFFDCSDSVRFNIGVADFNFDYDIPNVICNSENDTLRVLNFGDRDIQFMWGPTSVILSGNDASEVIVSVDNDTEITLSMVDSQTGCQFDTSFILTASSITADIIADPGTDINLGESVDLSVVSNGMIIDYDWSDPALNGPDVTVSPEETTTYTVVVTDENGCTAQASITITVRQPQCDETDVFLPNAFTPNNDGTNDVLLLRSNFVREMELIIYDRWGKEVFSSTNQNNGWDGTKNGDALASDAYAYYLKVLCINDVEYIKQGNVSLLR